MTPRRSKLGFTISTLISIAGIHPEHTVFHNSNNAHEQAKASIYPHPIDQGAFLLSDGSELLE